MWAPVVNNVVAIAGMLVFVVAVRQRRPRRPGGGPRLRSPSSPGRRRSASSPRRSCSCRCCAAPGSGGRPRRGFRGVGLRSAGQRGRLDVRRAARRPARAVLVSRDRQHGAASRPGTPAPAGSSTTPPTCCSCCRTRSWRSRSSPRSSRGCPTRWSPTGMDAVRADVSIAPAHHRGRDGPRHRRVRRARAGPDDAALRDEHPRDRRGLGVDDDGDGPRARRRSARCTCSSGSSTRSRTPGPRSGSRSSSSACGPPATCWRRPGCRACRSSSASAWR